MSKKPSKSRKAMHNTPMHTASKQVAGHLNEKLNKELGKRAITLRKGDTVKILRGAFRGKEGKITKIERMKGKVFVEKIVLKKSNGEERAVSVDASKLLVLDIDRTDRKRIVKKESEKK